MKEKYIILNEATVSLVAASVTLLLWIVFESVYGSVPNTTHWVEFSIALHHIGVLGAVAFFGTKYLNKSFQKIRHWNMDRTFDTKEIRSLVIGILISIGMVFFTTMSLKIYFHGYEILLTTDRTIYFWIGSVCVSFLVFIPFVIESLLPRVCIWFSVPFFALLAGNLDQTVWIYLTGFSIGWALRFIWEKIIVPVCKRLTDNMIESS